LSQWLYEEENAQHRERPYYVDSTGSRPISEVKLRQARSVLRWGTTWEARVLFFFGYSIKLPPLSQPIDSGKFLP
ncbi:unnamed protein product, partial [Phaeothamnion confervicola]